MGWLKVSFESEKEPEITVKEKVMGKSEKHFILGVGENT